MPIMNEAMPLSDWERTEKGERIPKAKVVPKPEPKLPKIENLLRYDDIPLTEFEKIVNFNMRRIRNEEGFNFIGYDVTILLKGKRGPGRPKEDEPEPTPRILKGWLLEGDFEKLRRQR